MANNWRERTIAANNEMLELVYPQIFTGVVTNVSVTAISIVVKGAINRYFGKSAGAQLSQEELEYPIISIPLAIGYYYNFIEKIEERLAGDNFRLLKHHAVNGSQVFDKLGLSEEQLAQLPGSELEQLRAQKIEMAEFAGQFHADNVSVELIFPDNLGNRAVRDCSSYLRKHTTHGSIESVTGGRPYGINYEVCDNDGEPGIKIVDYVRPVELIPKYYKEEKGISLRGDNAELWQRIEDREMQSFLYTIKTLIEDHSKFLYDKVHFRPLCSGEKKPQSPSV